MVSVQVNRCVRRVAVLVCACVFEYHLGER